MPGGTTVSVIAHRGGEWGDDKAPENSLAAALCASDAGADGIEIDVHPSSDGEVFVMHDTTLDRTTELSGPVNSKSSEELIKAEVPTLQSFVDLASARGRTLIIELKASGWKGIFGALYQGLAGKVLEIVKSNLDNVIVQSFQFDYLRQLRALSGDIRLHLLSMPHRLLPFIRNWGTSQLQNAIALNIESINIFHLRVSASLVKWIHEHGCQVAAWTVNDKEVMRLVVAAGVDTIITDNVTTALNLLV